MKLYLMVAEWYVQFYPKKYFEELRKAFESGKKPDYAELERHAIKRQQIKAA